MKIKLDDVDKPGLQLALLSHMKNPLDRADSTNFSTTRTVATIAELV